MTMSLPQAVLLGWAGLALVMVALWVVERVRRDASLVDVGWAFGVGALALFFALVLDAPPARRALVAAAALAWSLRLGGYLLADRVIGKEEDGRYRRLRREWGRHAGWGFFVFFQAQALAALVFALPMALAMLNRAPVPGPFDVAALALMAVVLAGESVADAQLSRWRADPANRGRSCRAGLWGWSRHPNYFFEWLHWFVYVLFAAGSPLAWVNLAAPALMLFFLFRVTGIPATEARALETRGDDYRDYQRSVSIFVPMPPRGGAK
jgi:steroid 5-alpha reductase family enzyme